MKFNINQQDLQQALNYCQGIIEKRSTLPILSNILLTVEDKNISITATDLESEVKTICTPTKVESTGSTTAPAKKLNELRKSENHSEDHNVRVNVKGGGCSGLLYDLKFDDKTTENDQFFEDNGTKIIVDKKSLFYVLGTELDFSDGLNGKGFQFKNPNATRTCGCGESFSV